MQPGSHCHLPNRRTRFLVGASPASQPHPAQASNLQFRRCTLVPSEVGKATRALSFCFFFYREEIISRTEKHRINYGTQEEDDIGGGGFIEEKEHKGTGRIATATATAAAV
jgi:hypothetical protein